MRQHSQPLFGGFIFLSIIGLSWAGWLDSYTQLVIMFVGVNIIMSTSLNLINGYMGEFSCGHAGFMAVGAYGIAFLSGTVGVPYALAVAPVLLAAVLLALIVAFFAIPISTLCLFDCKLFPAKKIASVLLFFFR